MISKLRSIIHLTSVHPRYEIRTFLKECVSLAHYGYDVSIVLADGNGNEVKDEVNIFDAGVKSGGRLLRMTRTVGKIYKKARELDGIIYHFHDPELIPVGLKLKKSGKIVIYDVHEDYSEDILNKEWIPCFLRSVISQVFDRYENYAVKKFDGVITATPHIREKFEKLNPNTIDLNNFPILSSTVINEFTEAPKSKSVVYIGAINRIRGIAEMISALELTDAKLVLAGNFSTTEDFALAKSMKGWAQVEYRGQVDRSKVAKILSESVAGIVLYHPGPNHDECQPNKLFEYMAARLPVIASNLPLWREIVEKNKCGICVNPLNPREIADAINWMLQNPSDTAEMGKNGLKAVLEKFNWEAESHKLIKIYEALPKQPSYCHGNKNN